MGEEASVDQNACGFIAQKNPESTGSRWMAVAKALEREFWKILAEEEAKARIRFRPFCMLMHFQQFSTGGEHLIPLNEWYVCLTHSERCTVSSFTNLMWGKDSFYFRGFYFICFANCSAQYS
jgi:hypothetical protein